VSIILVLFNTPYISVTNPPNAAKNSPEGDELPYCPCSIFSNSIKGKHMHPPVAPPWTSLLQESGKRSTNGSQNLFVWTSMPSRLRLGNQLFNYASLYGIAWRNGRIPLWPDGSTLLRNYFNITMPIDRGNTIKQNKDTRSVQVNELAPAIYNNDTEALPERNVTLGTYLQSWKYFAHVDHQLRHELTFKDHIIREARSFVDASTPPEWKGLDFIRVAIHVRRGDHTTPSQQRNGWPVATAEYFNKSMRCFTNCFKLVQFIVLSEDYDWCSRNVIGRNVVFSRGHQPVVDMAIASLCDHAIITVGSFGIWCSWFANGVTITEKDIPLPGSAVARAFPRVDYFRPEYIGL
jgi:galactoside 2-L-fucosyltransferase 1/2